MMHIMKRGIHFINLQKVRTRTSPTRLHLVEKQIAGFAVLVRAVLALLAGFALFVTVETILLLVVLGRSTAALHASLDASLAALLFLAGRPPRAGHGPQRPGAAKTGS